MKNFYKNVDSFYQNYYFFKLEGERRKLSGKTFLQPIRCGNKAQKNHTLPPLRETILDY